MSLDLTAQLPVEVLLGIFDCLCLSELAPLTSVCSRWAIVVQSHPSYWSFPQLTVTTPAAVAFFRARLHATSGRPFIVRLSIEEPFPVLDTTLFPALARHLDCIVSLIIHVHISHAEAVWALLRGPAPSLRYLQVFFETHNGTEPGPPTVALPVDILSRTPPHTIESVLLKNVDVIHAAPLALSTVANLFYSQKTAASCTTLQMLADAFPCARDVSLFNRVLRKDVKPSDLPHAWADLDSLTLGGKNSRQAIRALPLENVRHLTAIHVRQREVDHVLGHLHGNLHMSFRDLDTGDFLIHLASWTDGIARSFRERWKSWLVPDTVPHDLLRTSVVLYRVITLTVPLSMWDALVALLESFDRLMQLTLVLSSEFDLAHLLSDSSHGSLVCPVLQKLCLAATGTPVTVTPDDVTRVIRECLCAPEPIGLKLQNVCAPDLPEESYLVCRVERSDIERLYPSNPWHMQ